MASDDIINLDSSSESDQGNGPEILEFGPSGEYCQDGTSAMNGSTEDIPVLKKLEVLDKNGGKDGNECMLSEDTVPNDVQEEPILEKSIDLVQSVVTVGNVNEDEAKADSEKGCFVMQCGTTISNSFVAESPSKGIKRPRTSFVEEGPFVHIVYNSLTRESKKKLMELMQQWSEWHAQHQTSSSESSNEALEFGEETYFPALHVGSGGPSAVSFWIDDKGRKEEAKVINLDHETVPLYDRGYTLISTSVNGLAHFESGVEAKEASRCFNCGSYSHSLKECPKPRDNIAISNARKLHSEKRNATPGACGQTRYYVKATGKFDDLKAGVLGPETRASLGIGEFDPPPWLNRMRELGYPPGYLDVVEDEDQPSGITIFADEEMKEEYEEGELPEKDEPVLPEKKMTVAFPGINAPVPENADHRLWDQQQSGLYLSGSYKNHSNYRGHYLDRRRPSDLRDDGPPGSDHGLAASFPPYSPRFNDSDHIAVRNMGRSLSERSHRSPLAYDNSPSQSRYSSHPYNSSPARWSPQHSGAYGSDSDAARSMRERPSEHRFHHSRK